MLKVRNIASVYCFTREEEVTCAVRMVITHGKKLYMERKDKKAGNYEYIRLSPYLNYSFRPFEPAEEVTHANLHLSGDDTELRALNNCLNDIKHKMYKRGTAKFDRIDCWDSFVEYVGIEYYNPRIITVIDSNLYSKDSLQ